MDITIVIATGFHRPSTEAELLEKFGPDILAREHIEIHVSDDLQSMVTAGILPSGGALLVNRLAWECDLLIAEGFIEPHFFAGFSGGRKAVLPGIVSTETVLANHCSEFIDHPLARAGILEGNPIHRDMLSAAGQVGLAFILNVVMNGKKEIVHAVCGHARTAHEAGCAWLASRVTRKAVTADIVITSNGGYPLDQNIYQAVKGMTAAEACCREGGVIIIAAACSDGHGGEAFYRAMRDAPSVESLLAEVLSRSREKTEPDQWEYQILCRILSKFTVVLVSDLCDPKLITGMKLIHAASLDEALDTAYAILSAGNNSRSHAIPEITVIPDGVGIIIDRQE